MRPRACALRILVNGGFVDPMRIKLRRGHSLKGLLMAGFEKERDRLDALMSNHTGVAPVSDAAATPVLLKMQ